MTISQIAIKPAMMYSGSTMDTTVPTKPHTAAMTAMTHTPRASVLT